MLNTDKQAKVTLTPFNRLTEQQKQDIYNLGLLESIYKKLVHDASIGRMVRNPSSNDSDDAVCITNTRDELDWYLPTSVITIKAAKRTKRR